MVKETPTQKRAPILYFDSGIGGIPYAVHAMNALPQETIVYLADRAGFPYGTKSPDAVKHAVFSALDRAIEKFKPKVIVIACNTATEIAIHAVRERYPAIPIIGTVPAIKPAAEQTRKGRIAVIATNRAVNEPYLDTLVAQHAGGCALLKLGASPLVSWIETSLLTASNEEKMLMLEPYFKQVRSFDADMLVLGCTHFLHMYKEFISAGKPDITIIDSQNGITKRLMHILETYNLHSEAPHVLSSSSATNTSQADELRAASIEVSTNKHTFWVTGAEPVEDRYRQFASMYGLTYKGVLS